MTLSQILESIQIGYMSNDPKSKKLKDHVDEVRAVLSEPNVISDSYSIMLDELDSSGNLFLQGSYATNTAIKIGKLEVDADIGIMLKGIADKATRQKMYSHLVSRFNKYNVQLKKPCITIDFLDGYKTDIAVYSDDNNTTYYFNSIGDGVEKLDKAKPKEFVEYLKKSFADNDDRRKVLRLFKYFVKIVSEKYLINSDNKIPSISLAIFIADYALKPCRSEDELYICLLDVVNSFKAYVNENGTNGPSKKEYYVDNTFYKVKDINEVTNVLEKVSISLTNKQYSEIVSARLFEQLADKDKINKTPSLIGTMG